MIRKEIKMFVCIECNHTFEVPAQVEERHGFDYGPFETFYVCPQCGESFVEAHKCDCCGEYITGEYIKTDNGKRYCDNCCRSYELGDEE